MKDSRSINRLRSRAGRALAGVVAATALGIATPALCEETEAPNKGRVSFSAGSDITTAYFFRGILQERDGFIWQPYGEVNFKLWESDKEDDSWNSFTLFGGSWNSVHSEKTLASSSGPSNWYEADVYAGAKTTIFTNTELKGYYIAYTYPGGAFNTVQEIDTQISFNDSEYLDKFALYPYVLFAAELENSALGASNTEGGYMELGVGPSFTLIDHESYPLTLTLPMLVGLSIYDYFESPSGENNTFGYFKGGTVFTVPLAFIPAEYGAWAFKAGAAVYAFGTNLEAYNKGNNPWVVGTWSVTFSY